MEEGGVNKGFSYDERFNILILVVILTGLIQILLGLCGFSVLTKLIPESAQIGFLNGLAIIVGLS
jgi:sulfate permease, SulP family